MKVTLFIPVLNEIEGIQVIMPRVKREWVDEVVIVDGGSTDGSREYFEKHGYKVISSRGRHVLDAWWTGFQASTGDVIIPFSPEGNSVPEVIPKLIEKMKDGFDVVVATRYGQGAKSEDDSFITSFGNWFFTGLINLLYGGKYTDALGMYKGFRRELIKTLELDKHQNEIFEILIAIRAAKKKIKVAEIPGDEPARIGGNISRAHPGLLGRIRGGFKILSAITKELFRWRK